MRKSASIVLILSLLFLTHLSLHAQKVDANFGDRVTANFMKFYDLGIPEKIYIQTDKPYYSAGEKMWYKAHLVNAITHAPAKESNFVYVELINRYDSIFARQKVKIDTSKSFYGVIPLAVDIPVGEYALRGYTQSMRNQGEEFFYNCNIQIGNPLDNIVNCNVNYVINEDSTVTANISLTDNDNKPIANKRVTSFLNLDVKEGKRVSQRTDAEGRTSITFTPAKDSRYSNIEISVNENETERKKFYVPSFSKNFDVQFFPEGGALLGDVVQGVAFKAIGTDGLSVDVTGSIQDSKGEEIAAIQSIHKGMGRFAMVPKVGEQYYAVVKNGDGVQKRFRLPVASGSGCTIQVQRMKGRIAYGVKSTPDVNLTGAGIVIHSRGALVLAEEYNPAKPVKIISEDKLPEGIIQIALVDPLGKVLSQRLVFIKRSVNPIVTSITPNKNTYGNREKVSLTVKITDRDNQPVVGCFGVAVTDKSTVDIGKYSNNIISYLLLSSDIRGKIEDPTYYFATKSSEVDDKLDLLMMTQGWTRFNLSDVVTGAVSRYKFRPEKSQIISGNVKGFFGNTAKNPKLFAYSTTKAYLAKADLGNSERFVLDDIDAPDSTVYILQVTGKNGGKMLNLNVDPEDLFPSIKTYFANKYTPQNVDSSYLEQSKSKYYYEGGMKVVDLRAISVTAPAIEKPRMYNAMPTHTLDAKKMGRSGGFAGYRFLDIMTRFPGVRVSGNSISVRGSNGNPLLYVDDIEYTIEEVGMIDMATVETIDLISGPEAGIFGLGASNGVILIRLKDGSEFKGQKPPPPSFALVVPFGYSIPEAFYSPRYSTYSERSNPNPDIRSTIFWDPSVRTDSTGVANISFYTADKSCDYNILIEGVSNDGEIVYATESNIKVVSKAQ